MSDCDGKVDSAFNYYPRLQKIRDYVDKNVDEDITLCKAARIACLEQKYFSTFFREKTGVTFKRWISGVRISRAKTMMEAHNYSITEVALAVGFRDLGTFERTFKRYTGLTPREYKHSVRPS